MSRIYKLIFMLSFLLSLETVSLPAMPDEDKVITQITASSDVRPCYLVEWGGIYLQRVGEFYCVIDETLRFHAAWDYALIAIDSGWEVGDSVVFEKNNSNSNRDYWITNLRTQTTILAWEHQTGVWGGSGDEYGGQDWEGI